MSTQPIRRVVDKLKKLNEDAKSLGCALESPFMRLSFLALLIIPELRMHLKLQKGYKVISD